MVSKMTKQEAIDVINKNVQQQIELFQEYARLTKDYKPHAYVLARPLYDKAQDLYRINNKLMMKHNIVSIARDIEYRTDGKWHRHKRVYIALS